MGKIAEGVKVINLSEALGMFLLQQEVDGNSAGTLKFYRGKVGMFIDHVGDKPVSKLTLQDAQAWVLHLQKRNRYAGGGSHHHKEGTTGISKATLRGYVRAIKVFATYLWNEDLTDQNVFAKLKMPKDTQRVVEVLSDDEIRKIYDSIETTTKTGVRQFTTITILLDTGIRASELLNMEIGDIDFKQNRIKVSGKGDKQRFVPFGSTTAKTLLKWINVYRPQTTSNKVFVLLNGEDCKLNPLMAMIKRIGVNTGIPRLHAHLFRHTFAVRWLRGGGDVFTLQRVLGHSSLNTTRIYMSLAQVDMDNVHRAVSPVDRLGIGRKKTR